jgi:hypothetical protein
LPLVVSSRLTFLEAKKTAEKMQAYEGAHLIVTHTGETRLPNSFVYILDLINKCVETLCLTE